MRSLSLAQSPAMAVLPQPYLLFLGDTTEIGFAKTALGLRDWAGEHCIGEYTIEGATVSTGLPMLTPKQASTAGARAMVIGVANAGGVIPDRWIPALVEALEAGLDLVSGMHVRLEDIPQLKAAALRQGCRLIDVRRPPAGIPIANGKCRSGKRLLTVGTDCALGKKYTALALVRAFNARQVNADFRASGQTGILIAGRGIPMDAVVSDFAAGAAEMLSPAADAEHWDVIEGQGSLSHPAYAGVSLALLHGSQPDVFVVCHAPERKFMLGYPDYPMPGVEETIAQTILLGRRTNPDIRCAGVSLNTANLDETAARQLIASERERLGHVVADPIRGGAAFEQLVDACLA